MEPKKDIEYEDFVNQFQNWFESCGLKNELKTFARTKIVNLLQSTNLSEAISQPIASKKSTVSPKVQAVNYLIAEYLLKEKFGYTFSVFSSELNAFDKTFFTNFLNNDQKFTKQELTDIIETLAINSNNNLIADYFKNNEAFLFCYFRRLSIDKSEFLSNKKAAVDLENKVKSYEKLEELCEKLRSENDELKKQLEKNRRPPLVDFSAQTDLLPTVQQPQLNFHGNVTNASSSSSSSDDKLFTDIIRQKLKNSHKKYDSILKNAKNQQDDLEETVIETDAERRNDYSSSILQPFDSLSLSSDIFNSNKS